MKEAKHTKTEKMQAWVCPNPLVKSAGELTVMAKELMSDFDETKTKLILNELLRERKRQHKHFGQQNHDFPVFLAILQEEIGEASKAWLQANFEKVEHKQILTDELRNELVQIAAVAVQMIEAHDRKTN